eukprot:11335488-Alexandrium_andersonii.AAC.1
MWPSRNASSRHAGLEDLEEVLQFLLAGGREDVALLGVEECPQQVGERALPGLLPPGLLGPLAADFGDCPPRHAG